ncbi:putative ATPase [Tumebacillus sp. BK434]|uniref:AAA family ATPase n=1 Tax=Tumebacillus sp. BK434 TaxID=2512169 RepID=UPI00105138A4|nr:ATP-binding protein [Tumebacillus sp. BK434]TCP55948.1 putative ATPase [Tumebacillus sp. BK434]
MITQYHVQNFKQLIDVQADFSNMNVIIGPNGAGKSSLLQSIDFLKAFTSPAFDYYLETRAIDFKNIFNKTSKKSVTWDIIVRLVEDEVEYEYNYYVKISPLKRIVERLRVSTNGGKMERIFTRKGREVTFHSREDLTSSFYSPNTGVLASIEDEDGDDFPDLVRFKNFITGIQTYLIWDPALLRKRSRGEPDSLGPNGQHLASVLDEMKKHHEVQFKKMVRKLQKFLPSLEDISIKGSRGGYKEIMLHEWDERGTLQFNSQQISDGTLRLIAMAYLRYGKRAHSVVSFEEPENGVHPPILRAAVQLIREVTQLKPKLRSQVFMTTHSPYVLDILKENTDSIFVMEKGSAGSGSKLSRISEEHLETAKLLFDNSLGNLWFSDFLHRQGDEAE